MLNGKRSWKLWLVASAALVGSAALWPAVAQNRTEQPPPRQGREGRGRAEGGPRGAGMMAGRGAPANLEGAMKSMGRGLRQLRDAVADPARKEAALQLINDLQRDCVAAKGHPVPEGLLKKAPDEAGRDKLKATYRKDLLAVLRKLVDLEQAVMEDKTEDATKLLDEIFKLRDAGHHDLGVNDEHH